MSDVFSMPTYNLIRSLSFFALFTCEIFLLQLNNIHDFLEAIKASNLLLKLDIYRKGFTQRLSDQNIG